jgi:NhaP-type Na+/H+ or K+/H+ antiporter
VELDPRARSARLSGERAEDDLDFVFGGFVFLFIAMSLILEMAQTHKSHSLLEMVLTLIDLHY